MRILSRTYKPVFISVWRAMLGFFVGTSASLGADLNVTGNITATGTISSVGAIDSDSNSQSFGAQSTSTPTVPGSVFIYADSSVPTGSIDSFKSLLNRTSASWLWINGPSGGPFVNAMRLDDMHRLLLFKSDGTTPGLTFTPQTYSIKFGTHANATLTGNTSTGLITAGGGLTVTGPLTVSGGITSNTGSFGGELKFDSVPYTPTIALSPTTGSASFAWGGVYVGTLTGNLTITSFTGTESAGKRVRFVLVCSGSQSLTFPASYRAGQTNATTTTFIPAAGRHVLLFESLDGAGLRLLTDTVFGQVDAASVSVAATPAHYAAASGNVEAHLAGIDTALASAGGASVSDTAYNATAWDGIITVAPSKNAVRDQLEAISAGATVPPKMANFWATADLANKPAGWLVAGEGGTPTAATLGGYSLIVKSHGNVAAPTFSPAAGTYSSTQNVTLGTATSGASIRYRTDGVNPTRSTGTVYSSPISIATTSTIRAIAYKDYWADSAVQSAAFTIVSHATAPTFLGEAHTDDGGITSITLNGAFNAGETVVLTIARAIGTITSITDSGGTNWSGAMKVSKIASWNSSRAIEVWAVLSINASTSITVNLSASSVVSLSAKRYSGVSAFGNTATADGTSATSFSTSATMQDANNRFVAGFYQVTPGTGNATAGTMRLNNFQNNQGSFAHTSMDNTQAGAGSLATSYTVTTASDWIAAGVELRSNP